ncbi:MAG TPA: hypothetical protein VFG89_03830 [Coriobacteriia bacterium]|nr:hypothetical protein [Coriobacteriia bacterium]
MNREVHYALTRQWALDEGFSEDDAETIAAADWDVDRIHNVYVWANKGYHFAWLGAYRRARRLFASAIGDADLIALGTALHCIQDAIGHGHIGHLWHWDGIDRWDRRSDRVRRKIEQRSRALLADYRRSV